MGIFINLLISKSVTTKEWENVYEETLQLIKHFPLVERRKVKIHNIDTICLVPTQERTQTYGWYNEKTRVGWFADGDRTYMRTAEEYYLPRNLVNETKFNERAEDAILGALPAYLSYDWQDDRFSQAYRLWGNKTQGEPYHIYLLSVAALIEARLGSKAFTYGDITRGQFKKAVEIANRYLEHPIEMPDRCHMDRFLHRVTQLSLSETEKLTVFEQLFLGTQDAKMGEYMRQNFSEDTLDAYWKEKFEDYEIGSIGFDDLFSDYLLWGFDLKRLCGYVQFQDRNGIERYDEFVKRVLDAKLHLENKNCADMLKIDQEEESPYGVGTLFAQFAYVAARNKKVDRYIPLTDIRAVLVGEIGDKCNVNEIIDSYIQKELEQIKINIADISKMPEEFSKAVLQDSSEVFYQIMEKKRADLQEQWETYDIVDYENLKFYENGDTMPLDLMETVGSFRSFMDSMLEQERYKELMLKAAYDKCSWLVQQNRYILIRDKDWDRVFSDIEQHPESFGRYYSIFKVDMTRLGISDICAALLINDDLYTYSKELADKYGRNGIKE